MMHRHPPLIAVSAGLNGNRMAIVCTSSCGSAFSRCSAENRAVLILHYRLFWVSRSRFALAFRLKATHRNMAGLFLKPNPRDKKNVGALIKSQGYNQHAFTFDFCA
jgi:hypothetical protein